MLEALEKCGKIKEVQGLTAIFGAKEWSVET